MNQSPIVKVAAKTANSVTNAKVKIKFLILIKHYVFAKIFTSIKKIYVSYVTLTINVFIVMILKHVCNVTLNNIG